MFKLCCITIMDLAGLLFADAMAALPRAPEAAHH